MPLFHYISTNQQLNMVLNFVPKVFNSTRDVFVQFGCLLVISACSLLFSLHAYSQVRSSEDRMSVYNIQNNIKLDEVAASSQYRVVSRQGSRSRIQFLKPTVRGWVSKDFVNISDSGNRATVRVDALNFRVKPEVSSRLLTQVFRGYSSEVFGSRNGFIKILAPASFEVLINNNKAEHVQSFDSANDFNTTKENEPAQWELSKLEDFKGEPSIKNSGSVQKNNDATPDAEQTHLLAPGDAISLLVFGESDLSAQNVRVPQNGQVSFPLIGSVSVLGKTTAEVEKDVAALLAKGYVRNPRLSISIFSYRPIFIRGEVGSSGSFPYVAGLTIAKAIALAGGVTDSARESGISITRDGKVIVKDLSVNSQVRVASGDIVSVEADLEVKEADSSYVFLHGEVVEAGAYEFKKGLTVEKAVVLAGGFTLRASKKKIRISRYESVEKGSAPIELKRVKLYEVIKPGDVINVGASWF